MWAWSWAAVFPVLEHELVAGPVDVDRQFGKPADRPGGAL